MPVRLRITLLFSLFAFIILGVVCSSIYYFSYQTRLNGIKTRLTNRAITTARLLSQQEILFVSSHSWDVAGAANAGMQTVFLEHDKEIFYALFEKPLFRIKNVEQLVQELKSMYQPDEQL